MDSIKSPVSHEESWHGEKFRALLQICQKINSERNLAAVLDLIAREATKLMEADRSSIFLLDREKRMLWSQVTQDGETIQFDARLGIAGAVVMTGQTISIADAYNDPRFYKDIDVKTGFQTHSVLAVPLKNREGEVIGAFEAMNKKQGSFANEDEELLTALAAQATVAIETARMFHELKQHRDQLLVESTQLWKELKGTLSTQNIIGTSTKIQQVIRQIEQMSHSAVDTLITGESGTGKELVAKAIHYNSPRGRKPLVALNCAALPESLLESELFGIEKGVATGVEQRIGKFEEANGGTLFLDEIGDLSHTAQAKILRVLQERVVEHVGGRKTIPIDVRILAATNKNLEEEMKKGNFRQDLYYRLRVIHIRLPALREVPQDVPLLANSMLAKHCQEMKRKSMTLNPAALRCLETYSWPGNVRELENEMKRLVVSVRRENVTEEDLYEPIRNQSIEAVGSKSMGPRSLRETVEELERDLIRKALQASQQNQLQAATALGLSRQGLIKKLKRYGIKIQNGSATRD